MKPSGRLNRKTTCDTVLTDKGVLSVLRSSEVSGIARKRKFLDGAASDDVHSSQNKKNRNQL